MPTGMLTAPLKLPYRAPYWNGKLGFQALQYFDYQEKIQGKRKLKEEMISFWGNCLSNFNFISYKNTPF